VHAYILIRVDTNKFEMISMTEKMLTFLRENELAPPLSDHNRSRDVIIFELRVLLSLVFSVWQKMTNEHNFQKCIIENR